MTTRRWALAACSGMLALLLVGCDGGDDRAPAATAGTPSPPATTSASAAPAPARAPVESLPPQVDRALEDIRMLAGEIGVRFSTSDGEREAAQYIGEQLRAAGYEVTIEPFQAEVTRDGSTVTLPAGAQLESTRALIGSPNRSASGPLLRAGIGRAIDLVDIDASGAVLVVDRGVITFATKALNAQAAGAVALLIVNNVPGPLTHASLGEAAVAIPVVGVDQADGAALELLASDGQSVLVRADRRTGSATSQNVVGRPSQRCDAYVGAHYDSVEEGPGANDNASGTAAMLELARTHHADGLCFVAFGSEEVGLVGSMAFVRDHEVDAVRFMLNLDMMGKITGPLFVATADSASRRLADRAAAVAAELGQSIPRGASPPDASSDHASFSEAGVPAITIFAGDDPLVHGPDDDVDAIDRDDFAVMLDVAAAVLRALLAE